MTQWSKEKFDDFVKLLVVDGRLTTEDAGHSKASEDGAGKFRVDVDPGMTPEGEKQLKAALLEAGIPANFKK